MVGRIIGFTIGGIVTLIAVFLISSQVIRPADLHDFQSADFYKTSAEQSSPGDTGLLQSLDFKQTLSGDLSGLSSLDVHVYPNFLPQIRRYAWYPYRSSDQLTVTPSWASQVSAVSVDGKSHDVNTPLVLDAEDHGREVRISAKNADGSRSADYVILVMPHTFPPLRTQVSSAEEVAPGIITGMQAIPGNPTFSPLRQLRLLLYVNGISGTMKTLRKANQQPFDDFLAADLAGNLDFEHREYLSYVNFVLDKFGTPLKYNNDAPRMITLPVTTSKNEGLLPKQGFIYKKMAMDTDENFAEAITRSFVIGKDETEAVEIPRHIDQFDDGHHIDVTPWETIQNLFYRVHPAGTPLKSGGQLDVDVLVRLDDDHHAGVVLEGGVLGGDHVGGALEVLHGGQNGRGAGRGGGVW